MADTGNPPDKQLVAETAEPAPSDTDIEKLPAKKTDAAHEARGRRLLCAIDGSEGSKAAFRFLLEKVASSERGDKIILLKACRRVDGELMEPSARFYPDLSFINETHLRLAREEQERRTRAARQQLEELSKLTDVPCETVVVTGDPRLEIPQFVAEHPVDVVVVGSRGLGTVKRLFLGSVSSDLVRHLNVPVIVVPPSRASKA